MTPLKWSGGSSSKPSLRIKSPSVNKQTEVLRMGSHAEDFSIVLLEKVNKKYGTTMLIVTHNNSIKNMVHKVIVIKDGMIVKDYNNTTIIPAADLEEL